MYSVKIVFTGGPCAGKTKLIEKTKEYFLNLGYNVLICPEAATQILEMGINLANTKDLLKFQKIIFDKQRFNEDLLEKKILDNKEEKYIILYDRGVLDNKAYCNNFKIFDKIIESQDVSEISFLDSYDLIIDLITTADGAEEKYTLETNKQRTESIEEAIILDKKTSNSWAGHRNIEIINPTISLDESFEIIKEKISNLLKYENIKEKKSIEINNSIIDFNNYNDNNSRLIDIQEIKLDKENKNICFVLYKRSYKNNSTYNFKVYKKLEDKEIIYYDKMISEEEYFNLLSKYKIKIINFFKQLSFIKERQLYYINFYNDKTILEYEENKLNKELILPEEIKIIENNKTLKKTKKHGSIS